MFTVERTAAEKCYVTFKAAALIFLKSLAKMLKALPSAINHVFCLQCFKIYKH